MNNTRLGATQYPTARNVSVRYDEAEDRVQLFAATPRHGRRVALITRRFLAEFFPKASEALRRNHPSATETTPVTDVVMQFEHMAAVSGRQNGPPRGPADVIRSEIHQGVASAQARRLIAEADRNVVERRFLVVSTAIRSEPDWITIALSGELRDPLGANGVVPEPVVALVMTREQTHRVLRLLLEQGRKAGWEVEDSLHWMRMSNV